MNYNNFKETAKHPALLTALAGFMTPTTIIPIAIGITAIAILKKLTAKEPSNNGISTDNPTVDERLKTTVATDDFNGSITVDKDELIRLAMSELGKRSARKRQKNNIN